MHNVLVNNFIQGFRLDLPASELPDGASPSSSNVLFDRNSIRIRPGRTVQVAYPSGGSALTAGLRCLAEYYNPAMSPTTYLVGQAGSSIRIVSSGGTWTTVTATRSATNEIRMAQYGNYLYLVDGNGSNPVLRLFSNPSGLTESVDLDGILSPTVDPTAALIGSGGLPPGTYMFRYTYGEAVTGTTEYSESGSSLILVKTIPAGPSDGYTVTVTEDAGRPAGSKIFVYMREVSNSPDYYRVGSATCTGTPGTLNVTIQQPVDYLNDHIFLPVDFTPPYGAQTLLAHDSRMWYGYFDYLHISNFDNPEAVPDAIFYDTPANYGGFVRIGTDGKPITALCVFGSHLYVFKETGVWRVEGNPSDPDFAVVSISTDRGAIKQEGVCVMDGNLLCFMERSGVWAFDGTRFFEIGRPVNSALISLANITLVYNPRIRQMEALPSTRSISSSCGQTAYYCFATPVGNLEDGTPLFQWSKQTSMPGMAAVYASKMPTPGLYVADEHKSANIYLVDTGATDDSYGVTGGAITYTYVTRFFREPDMTRRKSVFEVDVYAVGSTPSSVNVIVTVDSSLTPLATITFTNSVARFVPAVLPYGFTYYCALAGTSSSIATEIPALRLLVMDRGGMR